MMPHRACWLAAAVFFVGCQIISGGSDLSVGEPSGGGTPTGGGGMGGEGGEIGGTGGTGGTGGAEVPSGCGSFELFDSMGATSRQVAYDVAQAPGGGCIVVGEHVGELDVGNGILLASGSTVDPSPFVLKIDTEGTVVWAKTPTPPSMTLAYRSATRLVTLGSDEIFVAGTTSAPNGAFLVRMTDAGEQTWAANLTSDNGVSITDIDLGNELWVSGSCLGQLRVVTTTASKLIDELPCDRSSGFVVAMSPDAPTLFGHAFELTTTASEAAVTALSVRGDLVAIAGAYGASGGLELLANGSSFVDEDPLQTNGFNGFAMLYDAAAASGAGAILGARALWAGGGTRPTAITMTDEVVSVAGTFDGNTLTTRGELPTITVTNSAPFAGFVAQYDTADLTPQSVDAFGEGSVFVVDVEAVSGTDEAIVAGQFCGGLLSGVSAPCTSPPPDNSSPMELFVVRYDPSATDPFSLLAHIAAETELQKTGMQTDDDDHVYLAAGVFTNFAYPLPQDTRTVETTGDAMVLDFALE